MNARLGRRCRELPLLRWLSAFTLAAALLRPHTLWAWNASGHMQIALAAHAQLSPELQGRLSALLREHPRFAHDFAPHQPASLPSEQQGRWIFAHAATWPDLARATPEYHHPTWHFINLRLRLARGALGSCDAARRELEQLPAHEQPRETLLGAIELNARAFSNPALPAPERALALSWLLHLVGDAHQPLHAVALFSDRRFPNGDRGGNEITLRGRGSLHRAWDELPGEASSLVDLERELLGWKGLAVEKSSGSAADAGAWIFEGCALARSHVYVPAVLRAVESGRENMEVSLAPAYFEAARVISERRMAQAAVRLASLLDRLAPPGPWSAAER